MSEPVLRAAGAARRLWLAPELGSTGDELRLDRDGDVVSVGAGRGEMRRLRLGGVDALVRRYRRGGALRDVLPDLFLSPERALAEVRALLRLAPLGLGPRALALEASGSVLLRLRLAVEEIPHARNLLELARESPTALDAPLGRAAGEAVRAMHDAGVAHPDLSVGNILVVSEPARRVMLIDFDGARLHESGVPQEEREREILRLARSLDKWTATAATSAAVRAAFLRAALPGGRRVAVLREARERAARLARPPR